MASCVFVFYAAAALYLPTASPFASSLCVCMRASLTCTAREGWDKSYRVFSQLLRRSDRNYGRISNSIIDKKKKKNIIFLKCAFPPSCVQ